VKAYNLARSPLNKTASFFTKWAVIKWVLERFLPAAGAFIFGFHLVTVDKLFLWSGKVKRLKKP
jgi:hypothetical protein